MSPRPVRLALVLAALWAAAPARADSILYRCGSDLCRMAPDGKLRKQLTTNGGYSWLSATPDGSRLAVSRATFAYVLDGSGHQIGQALPRGGTALVAQIAPRGDRVATLELLGETTPGPAGDPLAPPLLRFTGYEFTMAPDGSDRHATARAVVDTAWLGDRLIRSDNGRDAPFARGLCQLASNMDFRCERDVARDPANDLSSPAVSPDGRLVAVRRAGAIALYDVATAQLVRAVTNGTHDGLPAFSPDGSELAFNRGGDIYVMRVDGKPGSERRIAAGLQPVWVTSGAACQLRRSVRPARHGRRLSVAACAPSAGRLTVTLTRHGQRVARRSVRATQGGIVTVTFPRRPGPLRATVRYRA